MAQARPDRIQAFLDYKKEKLKVLKDLEDKRLQDLKDARATIFKYALPATIIDGAAGALATLLGTSVFILFPVALFVILIYFLADALDKKKLQERIDIMNRTKKDMDEVRRQEVKLLNW